MRSDPRAEEGAVQQFKIRLDIQDSEFSYPHPPVSTERRPAKLIRTMLWYALTRVSISLKWLTNGFADIFRAEYVANELDGAGVHTRHSDHDEGNDDGTVTATGISFLHGGTHEIHCNKEVCLAAARLTARHDSQTQTDRDTFCSSPAP